MDNHDNIKKTKSSFKFRKWDVVFFFLIYSNIISITLYGQEKLTFFGEGFVQGVLSSEDNIPFWFYTNSSTRLGEFTNGLAYAKSEFSYDFNEKHTVNAGVSLMIRDGVTQEFQRENLFFEYKNPWLKATIGARERPVYFNGLSSTNGNMIWSLNARPMPGVIIEASNPFKISNVFSLDWGIAHYLLNDDRYVEDTRVHYKRIGLLIEINDRHKIKGQLQHFAQWAGTSPEHGQLPNDFEAFIDVFFARSSSEDVPSGENQNSVGNHLGSYLLEYQLSNTVGVFNAYHEHPFDDGSGTGLSNFPDGVWGFTLSPVKNRIFNHFIYEYIDTSNQSGNTTFSGNDNYFNNGIYRSGWTYEGNIIGVPLILVDKTIEITPNSSQIISNRVKAHHIGLSGVIKKINWIYKTTYAKSLGTYGTTFQPNLYNWYNYLSVSYKTTDWGVFSIQGGVDTSNYLDALFGGGLSYQYNF